MKKQTKIIKKKKAPTNEVEEISDDYGKAVALHNLHDSEGGQLLIEGLTQDVLGAIDYMSLSVGSATHIELVAFICKIKERIDVIRVLTSAKANQQEYKILLAEAIKKQKENQEE